MKASSRFFAVLIKVLIAAILNSTNSFSEEASPIFNVLPIFNKWALVIFSTLSLAPILELILLDEVKGGGGGGSEEDEVEEDKDEFNIIEAPSQLILLAVFMILNRGKIIIEAKSCK